MDTTHPRSHLLVFQRSTVKYISQFEEALRTYWLVSNSPQEWANWSVVSKKYRAHRCRDVMAIFATPIRMIRYISEIFSGFQIRSWRARFCGCWFGRLNGPCPVSPPTAARPIPLLPSEGLPSAPLLCGELGTNNAPRFCADRSLRLKCVGAGKGSGRPWFGPLLKKIFGRQASRSSITQEFLNFSTSASFPLKNVETWVYRRIDFRGK